MGHCDPPPVLLELLALVDDAPPTPVELALTLTPVSLVDVVELALVTPTVTPLTTDVDETEVPDVPEA